MGILNQAIHGIPNITGWIADGRVVEPEEAQRRANICLFCPNNVNASTAISIVASGVRRLLEMKNKLGLRVAGEHRLGQCSVCQCVLKLQVHEPLELVEKQRNKEHAFPSHCWKI